MSKVFFFSSNVSCEPYPVYPLGMAMVASALLSEGHQVRQMDFLAEHRSDERLRQAIAEFSPDVVAISLRNIDNLDSLRPDEDRYLAADKHLVQVIRAVTTAPIVLGGPAFSLMPDEILRYVDGDYGIVGEGERVLCTLIHTLSEGGAIPRIMNGSSPALNGTEMYSPLWEKDLVHFYLEKSGMINLQTKRGCPYDCLYCTYPSLEGRRFRPRETEAVIDDIDGMKRAYGVDTFYFTDSVFNDREGLYLEVAERLISRGIDIRWAAFFSPNGLGSKELALLKRSGLYAMEVGTDAASEVTLRELRKRFSFDEVIEFNRLCNAQEIPTAHFILFGGPGETGETLTEGLANLQRLENCVVFAFSGIRILPGTGIHRRAVREGILQEKAPLLKPVFYFSPLIHREAMNQMIRKAFKGRRDRIFPPSEAHLRIAAMNRFGYRGIIWDKLISFDPDRAAAVSARRRRG